MLRTDPTPHSVANRVDLLRAPDNGAQRPRVLVCAYACNPTLGSEAAVGWNWLAAIASFCEVTAITAAFHRPAIAAHVAAAPTGDWSRRVHFVSPPQRPWHYAPTPGWQRIEVSIAKPLMHQAYRAWQRDAARLAGALVANGHYDLTHQLTYVGFRFPGGLWRLPPPFVWGPLGGLEDTPWRLFGALDLGGMFYFGGRNLINALHRRLLRAPRRAAARAGPGLIAATSGIARQLRACYGRDSRVITEVTAPLPRSAPLTRRQPGEPLRIAWSGQHTAGKALPLLLRALAGLPAGLDWALTIFGTGPSNRRWRALAGQLGVDGRCHWPGQMSRATQLAALDAMHLFVITSLKDLTSTVLVEALSRGLPVLCPDHCGFSDALTATAGRRLPISTPDTFVRALRESIAELHDDEEHRHALALGALRRSADFSLAAKAQAVREVYARVLADAPDAAGGS